MEFVELPAFTRRIQGDLDDEALRDLQNRLYERPTAGAVIKGSGGFRKIRVALKGRGKRGGGRVIYYYDESANRIYLLFFFAKNERSDLNADQLRTLKRLLEE